MDRRRLIATTLVSLGVSALALITLPATANAADEGSITVSGTVTPKSGNQVITLEVAVFDTPDQGCPPTYSSKKTVKTDFKTGVYKVEFPFPSSNTCMITVKIFGTYQGADLSEEVVLKAEIFDPGTLKAGDEVTLDSGSSSSSATPANSSVVVLVVGIAGALALLVWLASLVGKAAARKGRTQGTWFVIALFFLVPAAIIVAIMKNESQQTVTRPVTVAIPPDAPAPTAEPVIEKTTDATRTCPYCAEEIKPQAIKCKHCGSDLESIAPN